MSCGGGEDRDVADVSLRQPLVLAPSFYGNFQREREATSIFDHLVIMKLGQVRMF